MHTVKLFVILGVIVIAATLLAGCPKQATVPDLAGLTRAEALITLAGEGLAAGDITEAPSNTVAAGLVAGQQPAAGAKVSPDSAVDFVVSTGDLARAQANVTLAVALPVGAAASLTGLKAVNSLGNAAVGNDGLVPAVTFEGGPHLTLALDQDGRTQLMGWVDASHTALNVQTTAEVLVFLAAGWAALPLALQTEAIALLRQENLSRLVAVLTEELAKGVGAFSAPNPALQAALAQTVATLAGPEKAMRIDPANAQSGIQVDITQGVNRIQLTNMFRRTGYVYIDREHYDLPNGSSVVSPETIAEFPLSSVVGLGSVAGTLANIIRGKYAYEYVHSEEIPLPAMAGADITCYRLTVVGLGVNSGLFDSLPQDRQDKQFQVSVDFLAREILIPFVFGIVVPAAAYSGSSGYDWFKYTGWPVYADWISTLTALPDLPAAIRAGDIATAASIALTAMADNTMFKSITANLAWEAVYRASGEDASFAMGNANAVFTAVQKVMNAVGIAGIVMTALDQGRVQVDLAQSSCADTWFIDVLTPKVILDPPETTIELTPPFQTTQQVTLTARVPEASGSTGEAPVFRYTWQAPWGRIQGHESETSWESSGPSVTYVSSYNTGSVDTIGVTVYEVVVDDTGTHERLVGSAHATITVQAAPLAWIQATLFREQSYVAGGPSYWVVGYQFNPLGGGYPPDNYYVRVDYSPPDQPGSYKEYYLDPKLLSIEAWRHEGGPIRVALKSYKGYGGDADAWAKDYEDAWKDAQYYSAMAQPRFTPPQ